MARCGHGRGRCPGLATEKTHRGALKRGLSHGFARLAHPPRILLPYGPIHLCSYSDDRESAVEALKDIISDLELEVRAIRAARGGQRGLDSGPSLAHLAAAGAAPAALDTGRHQRRRGC